MLLSLEKHRNPKPTACIIFLKSIRILKNQNEGITDNRELKKNKLTNVCVCLCHTWSNVWRNPVVLTVGCTTDFSGRHQGGCSVPWTHTRVLTTKNYLASHVNNAKVEKTRYKAFVISLTNSSVFLPRLHSPHLVFANLHKILVQLPEFTQMWFMLSHTFFRAWCSYILRKKRNDKNHSINPKDLTMWPRGGGAIISALLLYLRNLY